MGCASAEDGLKGRIAQADSTGARRVGAESRGIVDDYFVRAPQAPQPPAYPPAPPQQWGPPAQPYPSYVMAAPTGMPTWAKVLIGIAIAFGGLFVIGIVAAIAIPVILNHHDRQLSDRTQVEIPAVAAGLALRSDPVAEELADKLRNVPLPGTHLTGAYGGTGTPEAIVSVTKHWMSPADRRDYLAGVEHGASSSSGDALAGFVDSEPGPLGGKVRCSTNPSATLCFFADPGAYGSIVIWDSPERAAPLVSQLRAAIEHRT